MPMLLAGEERASVTPTVVRLRGKLEAWLDSQRDEARLVSWVEGNELPPVGHDEEPYVWLLRALTGSGESYRRELAARLAAFFAEQGPAALAVNRYDEQFLYNLLSLSGGLRCPEELADPLYHLFRHLEAREGWSGAWQSRRYDLGGALRDALVLNQRSPDLRAVWYDMLSGEPHPLLWGNHYSGFEGILHMPRSVAEPGLPAVKDLGWALAQMCKQIEEPKKKRATAFSRLIERIKRTWPDYRNWDEDLLFQACQHEWPDWAVVRLDDLIIPLDKWTNGKRHFLLWELYFPYLETSAFYLPTNEGYVRVEEKMNFIGKTRNRVVAEVALGDYTVNVLLNSMRVCVDDARLRCPFPSYNNVVRIASEELKNMAEMWIVKKKNSNEAEDKDSVFAQLTRGRIQNLADIQSPERREQIKETLNEAASVAAVN